MILRNAKACQRLLPSCMITPSTESSSLHDTAQTTLEEDDA